MSAFKGKADLLPSPSTVGLTPRHYLWQYRLVTFISIAALWSTLHIYAGRSHTHRVATSSDPLCPQADRLTPVKNADLYNRFKVLIETDDYKLRAIDWLSGAVKIPTESYDKMGSVGQDPRWEAFAPFHAYLLQAFPFIHSNLKLTKVNTYGLVYHWQGSNPDLKPLLLTAHQDVVPVDPKTVDKWIHPPYSGHFDGTYIWGRGSNDDKSGLISSLASVETLLERKFSPTRTIVLAFGFDEETSGEQGAQKIAAYLLGQYGENAFALLVDEGGGWGEMFGQVVAVPAVAEKGYLDIRVEVSAPGGHSSIPPPHTSIGILSALLVSIESNPQVPHLGRAQPTYETLLCVAEHAPDMPARLRKDAKRSVVSDKALRRVEKALFALDPAIKAIVGTTQAIDLISGGVKANALPEQAAAVVNHRIATDSSVDAVKKHVTRLLAPLAAKFNVSFTSFGTDVISDGGPRDGSLKLTDAWGTALEPAPVSPTNPAAGGQAFKLLSGAIKSSLLDSELFRNTSTSVVVAPGIMSGNTDTRYYWKLTPNIFRYSHQGVNDSYAGIHTINEAMKASSILRQILFFGNLILNVDESHLI